MLKFIQFLKEGGNLKLGDIEATRIDLRKINRQELITKLEKALVAINKSFKRIIGDYIWSSELLQSKKFLSGSSVHLFDRRITDHEFVVKKPVVGDVDLQVNKDLQEKIKKWLDSIAIGEQFGDLSFYGYKTSGGQYITLWNLEGTNLYIQIDLELVEYKNNVPTEWSIFSRSSSWLDIQASVKGVFHKYLLRALTAKNLREVTILKGKKALPQKVFSGDYSFSVLSGLRKKLQPTDTPNVYRELKPKESNYITNIAEIFKILLGTDKAPTTTELEQFASFIGLIKLIKKYLSQQEIDNVVLGFAVLLWGDDAQGLVRGDAKADFEHKRVAYELLLKELGKKHTKQIQDMIEAYYKKYK